MHDRPVEAQKRGYLILVERDPTPEGGQNEPASLRASGLLFKPLPDGEIGLSETQDRILQNLRRDQFFVDIKFSQARDVFLVAHLNSPRRDTGVSEVEPGPAAAVPTVLPGEALDSG
jgi:hypothetical protein